MRKIVIHCTTNEVGTDSWEFVEVEEYFTDDQLNILADEFAINNAEMYGIYPPSENPEEDEKEGDDNIQGVWCDYVPEKHDMHTRNNQPNWE